MNPDPRSFSHKNKKFNLLKFSNVSFTFSFFYIYNTKELIQNLNLLKSFKKGKRSLVNNLQYFNFLCDFIAPGSGIRISNAVPDPDPGVTFNADPCGSRSETLSFRLEKKELCAVRAE